MSFRKHSYTKFLTTKECEEILADPEFWNNSKSTDVDSEEVEIAIIPPEPDELTDTENFDENNLEGEEAGDVAGTIELFCPNTNEDSELSSDDEPLAVKKYKLSKMKNTSYYEVDTAISHNKSNKSIIGNNVKMPDWTKDDIKYTNMNSSSENSFQSISSLLNDKTTVEIFEEFFSENVVNHIIHQSTLYAQQKNHQEFAITADELRVFLAVLLFSGYHKLPQEDMYWQQSPDAGVPLVYNALPRRRFREIKKYLHLSDNAQLDKNDKMFKVRPFFDIMKQNFLKFGVVHSHLSIDEMMVRYYGRHSAKMYMRGKPIKFGYKLWCLCSSDGYLYNFEPYCGKSETIEGPLGVRVITNLISAIPIDQYEKHELFFDNFFTSHGIMCHLRELKMKATGTIRENRTQKCPLISNKQMEKEMERGNFDYKFDRSNEILILKWNDNKPVSLATNYSGIQPLGQTKRYSRKDKKQIQIPILKVIQEYNSHMGGVDMLDKFRCTE